MRALLRNVVAIAGALVVTASAVVFLVVFLLDLMGLHANPYLGIVFFVVVPMLFVLGLILIPAGVYLERRRIARGIHSRVAWPVFDLNNSTHRRALYIAFVLTIANVVIVSLGAYRGVEYMDSTSFCGRVCHEVMEPEYVAFQDGPHSRVACVQCHIGPGASWFVKSKLDGTRQVLAVLMNSHSRPIESPVHTLRPAREVCEQCHWPEKFHGDKVVVRREYAEDEQVSESVTTLRVHVGGGSEKIGVATGIHWHMNVANEVEYITTDDKRQVIPYVRVKDRTGAVREFWAEGVTPDQLAKGERRRMDCMDCHNRPSHDFASSPERAVDDAIASGEIPRLPFVKREVVAAIKAAYPDRAVATQEIATRLSGFYSRTQSPVDATRRADVDRAVGAAQRLYGRNVFPAMKLGWGHHPNNIGHIDAPGCFRCHDDSHKTRDGQTIKQDCDLCHSME